MKTEHQMDLMDLAHDLSESLRELSDDDARTVLYMAAARVLCGVGGNDRDKIAQEAKNLYIQSGAYAMALVDERVPKTN